VELREIGGAKGERQSQKLFGKQKEEGKKGKGTDIVRKERWRGPSSNDTTKLNSQWEGEKEETQARGLYYETRWEKSISRKKTTGLSTGDGLYDGSQTTSQAQEDQAKKKSKA